MFCLLEVVLPQLLWADMQNILKSIGQEISTAFQPADDMPPFQNKTIVEYGHYKEHYSKKGSTLGTPRSSTYFTGS